MLGAHLGPSVDGKIVGRGSPLPVLWAGMSWAGSRRSPVGGHGLARDSRAAVGRGGRIRSGAPPAGPRDAGQPARPRTWLLALALLVTVLCAYRPAWTGKPVWDDDGHMTRPELRSGAGLVRIWTELGATQQYYPLVHTAFWLEHRLFGETTIGADEVEQVVGRRPDTPQRTGR